jgi:succinyl-CoA synthetase beta subunit
MNIHEYLGAELLRSKGIPTGSGKVAHSLDEGLKIARELSYPVVLKAQVLSGGRGKAGGVKIAKTEDEFKEYFQHIHGMNLKGCIVQKIFIVKAVKIVKEVYLAMTFDYSKNGLVLIGSAAGGMDIEKVAAVSPEKIHKLYLKANAIPSEKELREFSQKIFQNPEAVEAGLFTFSRIHQLFLEKDCTLIEINPFALTDRGEWIAADAKFTFDDNALFRHEEVSAMRDLAMEDSDEIRAREMNLSFVKLDGEIGCIVNGAGLAMATLDIIKLMGGNPANFLDVGGSSNPQKMVNALKLILRNPKVKGILINIFGGITRCDDIANGLLQALSELNIKLPYVIRLTGTNEKEAREILAKKNISCFSTMREAVTKIIETIEKH